MLEHLVSGDPQGAAEFGGFYGQASTRLGPLLGTDRRVWLLEVDGAVAGFVDADNDSGRVELAYFVIVSQRGRGVAKQAVKRVLTAGVWPEATVYAATIADENVASIGVVRAAGLRPARRTDDRETVWESPTDSERTA